MNVMSSYQIAVRQHGICKGTVWKQQGATGSSTMASLASTDKTCDYCVLSGVRLHCYESLSAYQRGDMPLMNLIIVGASAWKPSKPGAGGSKAVSPRGIGSSGYSDVTGSWYDDTSFRIVSSQGTHYYCQAPTTICRDVWLAALYAGLEQELSRDSGLTTAAMAATSPTSKNSGSTSSQEQQQQQSSPERLSFLRRSFQKGSGQQPKKCVCCGVMETATNPLSLQTPLLQHGHENRVLACNSCAVAQGLLHHMEFMNDCLESAIHERKTLREARKLIWDSMTAAKASATAITPTPTTTPTTTTTDNSKEEGTLITPTSSEIVPPVQDLLDDDPTDTIDGAPSADVDEATISKQQSVEIVAAGDGDTAAVAPIPTSPTSAAEPGEDGAAVTAADEEDDAHHHDNDQSSGGSGESGGSSESWTHVHKGDNSSGGSGGGSTTGGLGGSNASNPTTATTMATSLSGSWCAVPSQPTQQQWIHLPPTHASTKALLECLQTAKFGSLARSSLTLEQLSDQVLNGHIGVGEFLEQLDEASAIYSGEHGSSADDTSAFALKKQAFRVAGDMGTALKLLVEHALPPTRGGRDGYGEGGGAGDTYFSSSGSSRPPGPALAGSDNSNTEMLCCILDFFLDLCEEGELSTVALFWPQFCHIHLRMLPALNATELARVELVEDFLLTVACRYSIHLALELTWSHTADLEESLVHTAGTSYTGSSTSTSLTTACAASSSRRRFAVLRFICELESLLFDFDDGWGGGSVSLGRMLSPSGEQVNLLRSTVRKIQDLRRHAGHDGTLTTDGDVGAAPSGRLVRSFRLERLGKSGKRSFDNKRQSPSEAAQEKLLIAKNAEYFSSHLNFTRRICDVTEKLRFMEIDERSRALEEELNLLNASGTLGGDPLNSIRESRKDLMRVVRVPSAEGHVFRSKERTPVLLLMEVMDEGAEKIVEMEAIHTPPRTQRIHQEEGMDKKDNVADEYEDATKIAEEKVGDDDDKDVDMPLERVPSSAEAEQTYSLGRRFDSPPPPPRQKTYSVSSLDDGMLEGASEGIKPSPRLSGLKRFDQAGDELEPPATTPKCDVELMMNSVLVQQIQVEEVLLPDLGHMSMEGESSSSKTSAADTTGTSTNDSTIDPVTKIHPVELSREPSSTGILSDPSSGPENESTKQMAVEPSEQACVLIASEREVQDRKIGNKKKTALGNLPGNASDGSDSRREVLNAIMVKGMQGDTIAAGTADSVQRSLQELERKRATELLMSGSYKTEVAKASEMGEGGGTSSYQEIECTRQKLVSLGFGTLNPYYADQSSDAPNNKRDEDEVMEAIRLLLIQNRVAQGQLSEADAAKVLQHNSLKRTHSDFRLFAKEGPGNRQLDPSEMPTIDAGDVDPRLVGCGALPPAILQAITLWKGEMVTGAELLELVKKDLEFLKHNILHEAENMANLNENSAFWGRFAFGERWAEKKARIAATSPEGSSPGWDLIGVIVKSNDDLRQEAFVMQLIHLCQEAFQLAGLDLWVSPYRILATGRTTGVIEMVRNAMSIDALKKRPGYGKGGLREHLQRMTEFTADPGGAFKSAQQNFVQSLAAYSLMSYFFQFKDRHNGNILLDTAGHLIHIDFGFVFGVAPGGTFSLEMSTPFKLTEDMINVMGGLTSPLFSEFVTLFCCGFLAIQAHSGTFLTVVEIMCKNSTFKCFDGRDTEYILSSLRDRFCLDRTKEETIAIALDLIKQATTSYGTRQYDIFQYLSQGIAA